MSDATTKQVAVPRMPRAVSYLIAARRTWLTEWRYTYRSARREWPRRAAVRKWARELGKGALDLPNYAREIRTHG